MTDRVHVAVDLGGLTQPAGVMHVDTARNVASTFTYDNAYLASRDAYALDPQLPLQSRPESRPGPAGCLYGRRS